MDLINVMKIQIKYKHATMKNIVFGILVLIIVQLNNYTH